MYVNALAIIQREVEGEACVHLQWRAKAGEPRVLELPGGRIRGRALGPTASGLATRELRTVLRPMSRTFDIRELIAARAEGLTVGSVEQLGEGDFCEAYLVNEQWVFRIARHDEAAESLRREVCLLSQISSHFEVGVPAFEFVSLNDSPAYAAHRLLPGPDLSRERYLALAEADRENCAHQVARFLRDLHATDRQLAQSCGVQTMQYTTRCAKALADAREFTYPHLGPADRAFVESRLMARDTGDFEPVVLHGDLSPDHVMFDRASRTVSGIIDFGDLAIGDPAWDFVYIYEDYGVDFLRRALHAYEPSEPRPLVERMYAFYRLDLIEWVAECAEADDPQLGAAIAELSRVRTDEERQRTDLFRVLS